MKVLITTDSYLPTICGVVTSVVNLSNELIRMGHEVRILTLSHSNNSVKRENVYYIKSFGINVYPNIRGTISFKDKCLNEILAWSPDIVHSQCEFFTFMYAKRISKKLNIPIVHTYHTMYEHYTDYIIKNQAVGKRLVSTFSKGVIRSVEAVIAPTEKVRTSLIGYGVSKGIEVIPTGIDLAKFRTEMTLSEKLHLKNSLGIPKENKIILSVGRLAAEKNIDEIIEYLPALLKEHEALTMIIVGDGPHRSSLECKARDLNVDAHIVFVGMVAPENISNYYQISDIFVSASESETQGLTYIEALANGLPEICKYDECLDGMLINGYNGFTYTNSQEFMIHMGKLLDDQHLYSRMSANAKQSADKYSSVVFVKAVENLYYDTILGSCCEKSQENNTANDKYA